MSADFLNARFAALYEHDARGRIVRVNEPGGGPTPRFHLMTGAGTCAWRFGVGVSDELAARLTVLSVRERAELLDEPPAEADAYRALLPGAEEWGGPAFVVPEGVGAPSAACVTVGGADTALLRDMADWIPDAGQRYPFVAVLKNERAVAVCASVRMGDAVHCAGVETHPAHRRKGYAADAVRGWAERVRARGQTPVYSTSFENTASRALAARMQLTRVATDFWIR